MNKTPTFIKLLLAVILVLGLVLVQQPPMAIAEIAKQEVPTNLIHIDVTYDPGAALGYMSMLGLLLGALVGAVVAALFTYRK